MPGRGALMPPLVCSLKNNEKQFVAPGSYHLLRFPFGGGENIDEHGMHQMQQPDGYTITDWRTDLRSGLIWPAAAGWGSLTGVLYWEGGGQRTSWDVFCRDPLGLVNDPNDTGRVRHHAGGGKEYLPKHHEIFVQPGVPLGLLVKHDAPRPVAIWHAQFKLAIHT